MHASDLRLDAPVRGLGTPPPALRAALRDAALIAWQALVELAVTRQAAFVILTGALFDADAPSLRACVALRDGLQRLRAHAIDVIIALADTDGPHAALLPWLGEATLLCCGRIDAAPVVRDGQRLALLRGASAGPSDALRLAAGLRPLGDGLQIGVLANPFDCARGGGAPAAGERPGACDRLTAALAPTGLHYWALGGAAARAVLQQDPWIVHAGTPQGRGLEPGEVGPKGCMVVDVEAGRVVGVTPAELDHVRFVSLELEVSHAAEASAIRAALLHELERVGGGDRTTVVEAVLRGRARARLAPDRLAFAAALTADLQRAGAAAAAPVWCVGVRDATARAARSDPAGPWDLGRIVTEQSEALSAPLPGSTFLARIFAPLLREWEAETDMVAQRELLRDAAALALDVLDGGGRS